jgi:hypothetical protein
VCPFGHIVFALTFAVQIIVVIYHSLVRIIFQVMSNLRSSKAAVGRQDIKKSNTKRCKITFWFSLDIGPRTMEMTLKFI